MLTHPHSPHTVFFQLWLISYCFPRVPVFLSFLGLSTSTTFLRWSFLESPSFFPPCSHCFLYLSTLKHLHIMRNCYMYLYWSVNNLRTGIFVSCFFIFSVLSKVLKTKCVLNKNTLNKWMHNHDIMCKQ